MSKKSEPSTLADVADLLSYQGAGLLAEAINAFWRARGAVVKAERYELPGSKAAYGVKSDLWNGLPRGQKKKGKTLAERKAEFLG